MQFGTPAQRTRWDCSGVAFAVLALASTLVANRVWADAAPAAQAAAELEPIGQFVSVTNPVDAAVYGRISRVATALQNRARQEKRKAVLVLEISDGPSRFGHVRELAMFLSTELPSLTTVAWVPKDLRGYNVILALACNEIVMHPKAAIGDVGRGKAVAGDAQSFVVNMVNRRHNTRLSEALALGMMDPQKELVWVRLRMGVGANAASESRVVLANEFERLIRSKVIIEEQKTIKAAGTDGMFSGSQARGLNVLVSQTAEARADIAAEYRLPRESLRLDPTAGDAPVARRIKVEGVITPQLEEFIKRQMRRSIAAGANLLVFEVDSPGGLLIQSMNLASEIARLDPEKVRTVAYIPHQAMSGAAIISLGCNEIYMHPDAQMGDAGPIKEIAQGGAFERAPEKVLSPLRVYLHDLAVRRGRPPALAVAMADKDYVVYEVTNKQTGTLWFMSEDEIHASKEEWEKGKMVPESRPNQLLTVNGARANALKLAEPPVEDFGELKQRLGISPTDDLPAVGATWVDALVFNLNSSYITGLLFVVGIVCIYAELHMASGFFGICATVCFALFFWSRFLGGTADWLELVLFLLGLGCIAVEVFVMPGFGVFGLSGGILVIGSLILASQTFYIPVSKAEYQQFSRSIGTLSGAIVGFIVVAMVLSRYLPRMPLLNDMVLVPPGSVEHRHEPQLRPEYSGVGMSNSRLEPSRHLVGRTGKAMTILRPAGKAQIDDKLIDVVSDGPFIEQGADVQVVDVMGNRVVVRQA